jgi:hypothetical protein
MSLVNIIMVFHRILDFKMGWISILALFFYIKPSRCNYLLILQVVKS